ncbi:MAG: hypothetical protein ACPGU5_01940 [Lishizhenia sp.]
MKYLITILICSLLIAPANSQSSRKKRKYSYAKGTLFGYWGYNRSAYTQSNINFISNNYDFTLKGAKASDNPEAFDPSIYFNLNKLTIPQFNARIGYYFKNNWAISFGYDHMKYLLNNGNRVLLDGTITPGIDTKWAGEYSDVPVTTDSKHIHYENSDGLNYMRFELTRTDQIYKARKKNGWFALSTNLGVSSGFLLSFNDFRFAGEHTVRTVSISGYGISAHANTRFEFLNHVYLQSGFAAGFNHQTKVRNRPNDKSAVTKHKYGYASWETVIGFLLYLRPTNGCDSCPQW